MDEDARGNRVEARSSYTGGSLRACIDLDRGRLWRETHEEPPRRFVIAPDDLRWLWEKARAAHEQGDHSTREQFALGRDEFTLVLDGHTVEIRCETSGGWRTVTRMHEIWEYMRRQDLEVEDPTTVVG